MAFPPAAKRCPLRRWCLMKSKHLEKKELLGCGLTVLESVLLSIVFLKISEMGKDFFYYLSWFSFWLMQLIDHIIYRWVLLEVLDKVSPGSVNWKHSSKPPIKMPFRKVENCNQVVRIGKQLKLSLVNVAGIDIVQGSTKLILGKFA